MRYEAKHRYFKQLAGVMGNFTNVAYTLVERYQRMKDTNAVFKSEPNSQ
jgi:hypothetical protein